MAEYLSPGVYVEEFESGGRPMEGVGTSTPGFIGLAEKGPVGGVPQLITNYANFQRMYGGYLSSFEFKEYRFLAYAVEHFFINGGSKCYVSRVAPIGAKPAKAGFINLPNETSVLELKAANPGKWGNELKVTVTPASKAKTYLIAEKDDVSVTKTRFRVKSTDGFNENDIVIAFVKDANEEATVRELYKTYTDAATELNKVRKSLNEKTVEIETLQQKLTDPAISADQKTALKTALDTLTDNYNTLAADAEEKTKAVSDAFKPYRTAHSAALKNAKKYKKVVARVKKAQDGYIEFDGAAAEIITSLKDIETKDGDVATDFIYTCEVNPVISHGLVNEAYEYCSLNPRDSSFIVKKLEKSALVTCPEPDSAFIEKAYAQMMGDVTGQKSLFELFNNATVQEKAYAAATKPVIGFENGANGSVSEVTDLTYMGTDGGPGNRTGIRAFLDNDIISLICVPGITSKAVLLDLIAHCENLGSRFAVLDAPMGTDATDKLIEYRNTFDSHFAALYYPWLSVYDPLDNKNNYIPPSGSVLGIYARSDNTRGVHKAPANEVVRSCMGLSCQYGKGEQDVLNPVGVNLIRIFPGQGIRVWGARTVSSNSLWRYINVRRLFIYIEESIKANLNWVVFEPNDEMLWLRVERTINAFLTTVWRSGALFGASEGEAFFINIGPSTMTQDDIDGGRLICVIGIAPVKPAEFVIFRLTQKTATA